MNLAQAEARSLPLLRYLKNKNPNNTTILNNLGQAYYALGELNSSKTILDSCIRIFAYHPQANFIRAIIAEKEGKNTEATEFIIRSLRLVYSRNADEFASKKGIKIDYSNILNRYRPPSVNYINPANFIPPAQCTNVFEAAEKKAEWNEWEIAMQSITNKINAALQAAFGRYERQIQQQLNNKTSTALFSFGPLHSKADKLYKVYLNKIALLQVEAQTYFDKGYKMAKDDFEKQHNEGLAKIEKKYSTLAGEGKGAFTEE